MISKERGKQFFLNFSGYIASSGRKTYELWTAKTMKGKGQSLYWEGRKRKSW